MKNQNFRGPTGPLKILAPAGGRLASLAPVLASLELLGVTMIKNWKIDRNTQNSKLATKKKVHTVICIQMNTNLKQISTLRTISIIKYQHRQNCSFTCFQKVLVPIFDGVNTPNLKKFSRLRFLLNVYSLCILRKHGNKNEFVPGSLDEFGTRIYRANLGYLGLYQAISSYHKQS